MQTPWSFMQSEHVIAFLSTLFIFLVTLFLVVKRWIGFSIACLLLLFSLIVGVVINHQQEVKHYFYSSHHSTIGDVNTLGDVNMTDDFHQQMFKAVENLKTELATEKENIQKIAAQVHEILESVDLQKQKLQNFMEEVREKFQTETPSHPASS